LARDLGAHLGVGGHLTALRRTRVGPFDLAQARTLDQLTADAATGVVGLPAVDAVRGAFGTVPVDEAQAVAVLHGNPVPLSSLAADVPTEGLVGVTGPDGTLLSLAEPRDGALRHHVVFS
ncbi:MAG TPA: tRNA pseudouridine(55) synthase TruB, partial [Candidatus Nanopelagicales bacterium]